MKYWDDVKEKTSGLWFNGPLFEDSEVCCGQPMIEKVEYLTNQAGYCTILECDKCGEKRHGGALLDGPREINP